MSDIWMSWHDHPRSRSLAQRLGIPLLAYSARRQGLRRHFEGALWTIRQLARVRPAGVFLQNSFLLLLICALYKSLSARRAVRLVVDCHNKSLKRSLGAPVGPLFWMLKRWSFRRADLVIVSNALLEPRARSLCGRVVTLRDPLPDSESPWQLAGGVEGRASRSLAWDAHGLPAGPYVVFVCSFEPDEPIDLVFSSANLMARADITSVVTGDARELAQRRGLSVDRRVCLPSFLPADLYRALLGGADCVIVLTNDSDCLVCGGYEAVAAGRPLVLSDTPLLRECFTTCAEYASHTAADVYAATLRAREKTAREITEGTMRLRAAFASEWLAFLAGLAESASCRGGNVRPLPALVARRD